MSKSTSFKNIQKILSKIFLTKVFFMAANIVTYLIALQYFGGVALLKPILAMNIFKAGCSYYGIEQVEGFLIMRNKIFKRLALQFYELPTEHIYRYKFFYISILVLYL